MGCASAPERFPVVESRVLLSDDPPPPPGPPDESPFDSANSVRVSVQVRSGRRFLSLDAWCRVGVWTTIRKQVPRDFAVRETWGRLGRREPKLIVRVRDQAMEGVFARLRPNEDGSLDFLVEVAEARIPPAQPIDIFHGQPVGLPPARRHGYHFRGRAPPGWQGAVARWGNSIEVDLGSIPETIFGLLPPGAVRFRVGAVEGAITGEAHQVEAFVEEWQPAEPVHVPADGVERMDYRLESVRHAAGFRTDADGRRTTYGSRFEFETDVP